MEGPADLAVNYGGRFDGVSQFVVGSQLSPRLNSVWQATPTTILHAGYARLFTPPPFQEGPAENLVQLNNFNGTGLTTSGGHAVDRERPAEDRTRTMLPTRNINYGRGRTIAPGTFVIDGAEDRGHPHFYCDATTLVALFAGFELLSLKQQQQRKPGSWHWHIIVPPPKVLAFSRTTGRKPSSWAASAPARPAMPDPRMTTSQVSLEITESTSIYSTEAAESAPAFVSPPAEPGDGTRLRWTVARRRGSSRCHCRRDLVRAGKR